MTQEILFMIIGSGIAALLVGLMVGMMIGRRSPGAEAKKAEKELASYKAAVSEHFGKTADLVDNLTNSYRDVFEHLGASAHELLSEEDVKRHLQSRADKAVTLTYLADQPDKMVVQDTIEATKADIPVNKSEKQEKSIETNNSQKVAQDSKKAEEVTEVVEKVKEDAAKSS